MKITRLSDHGLQLTRFGFVNCYLVHESDGFTLIDTTLPGAAKDLLAAASAAGAPIRRILLTHAHGDHVGSVDALVAGLPGVLLAAGERSLPLLRQPPDLTLAADEPGGKIHGSTPGIASTVAHVLQPGELFGSLRVIETPGHIPGHLSLLDERDGTLYAGDALITFDRTITIAGFGTGWRSIFNNFTWNKDWSLTSAKRLLDYPFQRIASGHGGLYEGGPDALSASIARTQSIGS